MNQHLQAILNFIQQSEHLSAEEKDVLIKSVKDADKEIAITEFKLDRTEKVKRTTAILLEETIAELEQKRKAVEEHNWELEVEAALERVRSRSMAMHKSDELKEVIRLVLEQFVHLKINAAHAGFYIDYKAQDDMHIWLADPNLEPFFAILPYFDTPTWNSFLEAKVKGTTLHTDLLDFEEKNKFYNSLFKLFTVPEEAKQFYMQCKGLAVSTVLLDSVGLYIENFEGTPYSDEENNVLMRFGKVFQQTYTRFLDLQKAEAQARESQIQLALERVRSRAMAMQTSEELNELIGTVFTELTKLDLLLTRSIIWVFDPATDAARWWMANMEEPNNPMSFFIKYHEHPAYLSFVKEWKKQNAKFVYDLKGKDKMEWDDILFNETELKNLPDVVKNGMRAPKRIILSGSFNNFGGINVASLEPLSDEHFDILLRFAKVFDLTYTRFLDLQKAEAQAREAQIQLALERVRARTMAMQKSEELLEVINIFSEQLSNLHINFDNVSFGVNDQGDVFEFWLASAGQPNAVKIKVPYFSHPAPDRVIEAQKKGIKFFADHLTTEENKRWILHLMEYSVLKELPEKVKDYLLTSPGFARSTFILKNINLYIGNYKNIPYSPEENEIFKRFAEAFEQSYTRFLDLQKAETQAREAQIEAALERVRSRSLAMHRSDELKEVIDVVFSNLNDLNISRGSVAIWLFDKQTMNGDFWVATPLHKPEKINLPYDKELMKENTSYKDSWEAFSEGKSYFNKGYSKQQKDRYFNYVFSNNDLSIIPQATRDLILKSDMHSANLVVEKHSTLFFDSWNGEIYDADSIAVFKRISRVFEQAYVRFLDLQKAEAQAREAQVEAALERVRSRTMAMQKSDELLPTAEIMFDQLKLLGAELQGVAFAICDKNSRMVQKWTSIGNFSHPYDIEPGEQRMYEAWKNQSGMYEEVYEGEKQKKYYEKFMEIPEFRKGLQKVIDLGIPIPTWQKNYAVPFKNGYVLFIITKPFEETQIFLRFGKVFEQTYTRFLDLQKAESQALRAEHDLIEIKSARKKAEEALVELQSTQKQLIQSEKMASLGELTAGIAHEIQNPLNFVNNFSEVSNELMDEMNEELRKGDVEEAKIIADDIKQNLEKINHHGKRAADIVKGMLQHSRKSEGKKELTDINALCDEYLRLSYHGLRAKDKSFNAKFETDFDPSIPKINVVLQDIGRVILNLINNAFYAVSEKKKAADAEYEPAVIVSTKEVNDKVLICVSDNGNGIPKNIVDKIFQPFFTTKPTGSGTGLGLSLSYDIVKAHGGEIKVETKNNEGTEFIIQLPF